MAGGKRGRPPKQVKQVQSKSRGKTAPSYSYEEYLYGQAPYDENITATYCFICNQQYNTTPASVQLYETAKRKVEVFCDNFKVTQTADRNEMNSLAGFAEPFCSNCSEKILNLQNIVVQLKQLIKTLKDSRDEINKFMISSFPVSALIGNTHYIKRKLVQNAATESKSDTKYDTINTQDLDFIVNQFLETVPDIENSVDIETQSTSGGGDFQDYDDDGQLEDSDEDYVPVSESPRRKSPTKVKISRRSQSGKSERKSIIDCSTIAFDPNGQCHLCTSKFPSQRGLIRHFKRHHSGITFSCRHCNKEFHDSSNRRRHELGAHRTNPTRDHVCDQCGKAYFTTDVLRDHIRTKHLGIKKKYLLPNPTPCPRCGKILKASRCMKLHMRLYHKEGGPLPIPCPTCGRPFVEPSSVRRHMISHMSVEERAIKDGVKYFYKCKSCPEDQIGFNTKPALIEHVKSNHPDQPVPRERALPAKPKPKHSIFKYKCTECPTIPHFKTEEALQTHIISGHPAPGSKRKKIRHYIPCEICGKPCEGKAQAERHKETHVARTYNCCHCDEKCYRIDEIRQHYAKEHEGVSPPPSSLKPCNFGDKVFFCPDCPDHPGFSVQKRLREHIRKGHVVGKRGRPEREGPYIPRKRIRKSRAKVRPEKEVRRVVIIKKKYSNGSSEEDEAEDVSEYWNDCDKLQKNVSPRRNVSRNFSYKTNKPGSSSSILSSSSNTPLGIGEFKPRVKQELDEKVYSKTTVPIKRLPITNIGSLKAVKVRVICKD